MSQAWSNLLWIIDTEHKISYPNRTGRFLMIVSKKQKHLENQQVTDNALTLFELLSEQHLRGKLWEFSGANHAAATSLIYSAQQAGELAVWVQPQDGTLYPPDLAKNGIDLARLPVIQVPNHLPKSTFQKDVLFKKPIFKKTVFQKTLHAAELLLRSGAFDWVFIDLGTQQSIRTSLLSRINGIAREHQSSIVFLSQRPVQQPSLGPLISARINVEIKRNDRFAHLHYRLIKDKVSLSRDAEGNKRKIVELPRRLPACLEPRKFKTAITTAQHTTANKLPAPTAQNLKDDAAQLRRPA